MKAFWCIFPVAAVLVSCVTVQEAEGPNAEAIRAAAAAHCVIVVNPGRARQENRKQNRPPVVHSVREGHDGWLMGDVSLSSASTTFNVRENVYVNRNTGQVLCGSGAWQARFGRGFF